MTLSTTMNQVMTMTKDDKTEFGRIWRAVRAEYGHECTAEGLRLVFNVLARFTIEQVKHGIAMHLNDTVSGRFKIQAADVIANIEGRGDERAGAAWSKLQRGISGVGSWDDALFDDPIIHVVVENEGGWVKVCGLDDNDMKFYQNRFIKQYVQYVSRSGDFKFPKVLTGTTNGDRIARGLEPNPPALIGDPERCKLIYQTGGDAAIPIEHSPRIAELLQLPQEKS